jgi:hypothetical protein
MHDDDGGGTGYTYSSAPFVFELSTSSVSPLSTLSIVWSFLCVLLPSALRIDDRENWRVDVACKDLRTGDLRTERDANLSDEAMLRGGV